MFHSIVMPIFCMVYRCTEDLLILTESLKTGAINVGIHFEEIEYKEVA